MFLLRLICQNKRVTNKLLYSNGYLEVYGTFQGDFLVGEREGLRGGSYVGGFPLGGICHGRRKIA